MLVGFGYTIYQALCEYSFFAHLILTDRQLLTEIEIEKCIYRLKKIFQTHIVVVQEG